MPLTPSASVPLLAGRHLNSWLIQGHSPFPSVLSLAFFAVGTDSHSSHSSLSFLSMLTLPIHIAGGILYFYSINSLKSIKSRESKETTAVEVGRELFCSCKWYAKRESKIIMHFYQITWLKGTYFVLEKSDKISSLPNKVNLTKLSLLSYHYF